jgi:hypothetical protein
LINAIIHDIEIYYLGEKTALYCYIKGVYGVVSRKNVAFKAKKYAYIEPLSLDL